MRELTRARTARWSRRLPVLYPTGIAVAFVLNLLVSAGVSPYAATRALVVAVALGFLVTAASTLVLGDRDRGGAFATIILLVFLGAAEPRVALLAATALALLAAERWFARTHAATIRWPRVTRSLTVIVGIMLLAIGIRAVQDGRAPVLIDDLIAGTPIPFVAGSEQPASPDLPDVYLVLLDGYPRADVLAGHLSVDGTAFLDGLADRGFVVAQHSRSNYEGTNLTLASLLNGEHADRLLGGELPSAAAWHKMIESGRMLARFQAIGYETVAISSGYEDVAVRRADRFVDTGQLNDFETVLLRQSAIGRPLEAVISGLVVDLHRARTRESFGAARDLVRTRGDRPQVVLLHVASPHAPLFALGDESTLSLPPASGLGGDYDWQKVLGPREYARRFQAQIDYLGRETIDLVDTIISHRARRSVVVVFSDHGTGVPPPGSDTVPHEIRTANLLAVRAPGHDDLIDQRSTLVNVLPRILRAYTGTGPADVAEEIQIWTDGAFMGTWQRPD